MFFKGSIIFFGASLISLSLIYYKVPTTVLQQIIIIFLIAILIILNRFIFPRTSSVSSKWSRPILLFLVTTMVQLIVVSTGGFFSPFLILLHLFALGTSFLLNLSDSVSFLGFSLIVLIANIWLNQNLLILFKDDPFSVALYFVSFIVIIPLAQLLNRSYHIKDALSRVLYKNLLLGQQREESILRGLNELVLVTDKDFKPLSINDAVEKIVKIPTSQILEHSIFDTLPIRYKDGNKFTPQNLSIPQILQDRAARIIDGFYLEQPGVVPAPVTIQVRPITDSEGRINQFVLVIKEGRLGDIYPSMHADLDIAHKKHQVVLEDFQKTLSQTKINRLKLKAEFLRKIEEDILIAQEIEDHSIKENVSLPDMAEVCKRVLTQKQEFAKGLNVSLKFSLPPEETAEMSKLSLIEQNVAREGLFRVGDFNVPIDPKWLQILLLKLLDIAILLASEQKAAQVEVFVSKQSTGTVNVEISSTHPALPDGLQGQLLTQYFGQLETSTNLRLGSGLEGFIAQTIASQLKLSLTVKSQQYPSRVTFVLELSKDRRSNS